MKQDATRGTKNAYMTLAAVAVVMLLSAALVVPSSNAYAISPNGKGKSSENGIFSFFFTLFGGNHNNSNGQTTTGNNGDIEGKGDIKGKAIGGGDEDRKGPKDPKDPPTPECKNPVAAKYNKHCKDD